MRPVEGLKRNAGLGKTATEGVVWRMKHGADSGVIGVFGTPTIASRRGAHRVRTPLFPIGPCVRIRPLQLPTNVNNHFRAKVSRQKRPMVLLRRVLLGRNCQPQESLSLFASWLSRTPRWLYPPLCGLVPILPGSNSTWVGSRHCQITPSRWWFRTAGCRLRSEL